MKNLLAILLIVICSSCATNERWASRKIVEQSPVEAEIREVVFRYQFQHNGSGQQQRAGAYFLTITELA